MVHESLSEQTPVQRVLAHNVDVIRGYQNGDGSIFSQLAFVDPESAEISASGIATCDDANRKMLDDVYSQVGIDPNSPNAINNKTYAGNRTVAERIFLLGEGRGQIAEMQTSYTDKDFTSFTVLVSKEISI